MTDSFDNKVYDILKSSKNVVSSNLSTVKFDQTYPIGSIVMSNKTEVPIKQGTWTMTGIYGVAYHEWSMPMIFNKDHVLIHMLMDASGQSEFRMGFNAWFADCNPKAIEGQSYTSPKSAVDPHIYYNFYDDKGGWKAWFPDSSHMTVTGPGISDKTRKYELTVLIKLNDFTNVARIFQDDGLTFEFTRTA